MELNRRALGQGGFSLLEAMIALVIFSVALLGLAKMYTQMMSMSHSAYFRTLATIQANDLEERIRANPEGVDDYAIASCENENSDSSLAEQDRKEWCENTASLFGAASFYPANTKVVTDVDDYVITIAWKERGLKDDADGKGVMQDFEDVEFVYRVRK